MKNDIRDLGILGGQAAFDDMLHVGRPNLGQREAFFAKLNDIWDRNWLTNFGPVVEAFEKQIASYLGVKHCIAMCNGTIALEIASRALGFSGEVIMPGFTFIATAHALQWQAITPIFCDIDPEHHTIDPSRIEQLITPKTSGIVAVHLWGRPCQAEAIAHIAKRNHLPILYDASHAFGCSHNGSMVGNLGDVEVFSFHATKFINSFEGGAVVTNNSELAAKIRLMKNFGFNGMDNVIYIGTNGKMSEVSAAMGLVSLEQVDKFIAWNKQNYEAYYAQLKRVPGIRLITYQGDEQYNYQYVVVEIDNGVTGINRDQLLQILHAENIRARRYFYPGCHRMEPYRSYYPNAGLLLPETNKIAAKVLCLPTGTAVDPAQIKIICAIIKFCIEKAPQIEPRIPKVLR
jgi:dTDP-4-amino-4,6-dideoxygalactose transaminase